jgi:hypothetical protein
MQIYPEKFCDQKITPIQRTHKSTREWDKS